jgi:hypothetical protein
MTVETDLDRAQYATNATTGPWTVPFYFLANNDLDVTYTNAAGVETTLTLNVDFTATGAGNESGGTVTTTAAYAAGGKITILRDMQFTQETEYVDGDGFPADAHEKALDRLTMICQQIAERQYRSLQLPVSSGLGGAIPGFPLLNDRFPVFDALTGAVELSPMTVTQLQNAVAASYALGFAPDFNIDIAAYDVRGKAIYDGVTDCAPAINAALAVNGRVQISGPARIKSQLVVPGGKWITQLPGAGIVLDTAFFTGARNTATGVGILFNGTAGGGITGGYIKPDVYIDARKLVAVRFVSASGFRMDGVEMSGFSQGNGIISVDSCSDWAVTKCRVHDCTSNSNADTAAQLTALTIDDNKVASVGSTDWVVTGNRFRDITVGSTFLAMNGGNNYQTDGITIEVGTTHGVVSSNVISNVGEAIDCWGSNIAITGNAIRHCYTFGVKLVHGASYCPVDGNAIYDCGLACIAVEGSSTDASDTQYNTITNNDLAGVNGSGNWSGSTPGCIILADGDAASAPNSGQFLPRNNLFMGNKLNPGPSGKYCIVRSQSTGGGNNFPLNDFVAAGSVGWVSDSAIKLGRITASNPTRARCHLALSQAFAAGVATRVAIDTKTIDDRGEVDLVNHRIKPDLPGLYRVFGQITLGAVTTANAVGTLAIQVGGGNIKQRKIQQNSNLSYDIEDLVEVAAGQFVELWFTSGEASASLSVNNGPTLTTLSVVQA